MSTIEGYVILWDELRLDGRIFAPFSVLDPEGVVGSVVSSHLNYHQPVGMITAAVNDTTGCLITIQFDFGQGRDRTINLTPVYTAKQAEPTLDGKGKSVSAARTCCTSP